MKEEEETPEPTGNDTKAESIIDNNINCSSEVNNCKNVDKTPPKKKTPKKSATDEGDEFLEEEIIDGFAFMSFKDLNDMQKWVAEDDEKRRKVKEAQEAANAEKNPTVVTPKPIRKTKERRNKDNDSSSAPRLKSSESMAIKRPHDENGTENEPVESKMLKMEPSDEKDSNNLINRFLSPPTNDKMMASTSSANEMVLSPSRNMSVPLKSDPQMLNENSFHSVDGSQPSVITSHSTTNRIPSVHNPLGGFGLSLEQSRPGALGQFAFLPGVPTSMPHYGMHSLPIGLFSPYGPAAASMLPFTSTANLSTSRQALPSCPPAKRQGKWCAIHVKIAWDIAKNRFANHSTERPSTSEPNPSIQLQTGLNGATSDESTLANKEKPLSLLSQSTVERQRNTEDFEQRRPSVSTSRTPSTPAAIPDVSNRVINGSFVPNVSPSVNSGLPPVPQTSTYNAPSFLPGLPQLPGAAMMNPALAQALLAGAMRPVDGYGQLSHNGMDGLLANRTADLANALRSAAPSISLQSAMAVSQAGLLANSRLNNSLMLPNTGTPQFDREQWERAEAFRRQQQQQVLFNVAGFNAQAQENMARNAQNRQILENQLMERNRQLLCNPMLMAGFPGSLAGVAAMPGLMPPMPPTPESLLGRMAMPGLPPPLPPGMANSPYLQPSINAMAAAKLPTPFSNTLEQLARQKRDLQGTSSSDLMKR